jgi:ubiquinone/menaquinone biosynthesis C-methylase UbiE
VNDGYTPDKSGIREGDRFSALEELFDAGTIQLLNERGVAGGWHCLEVGAGRGSIAAWLSERVGPTGRVIATDMNTRFLDTLQRPNLEVRRHNIVTDPLPEHEFDLVRTSGWY